MKRQEVEKIIKQSDYLNSFIEGHQGFIEFTIERIPIVIFKEDVGTSFYYRLPWSKEANYATVCDFMRYAVPVLSKLLEMKREEDLYAPGNIRKATLRGGSIN